MGISHPFAAQVRGRAVPQLPPRPRLHAVAPRDPLQVAQVRGGPRRRRRERPHAPRRAPGCARARRRPPRVHERVPRGDVPRSRDQVQRPERPGELGCSSSRYRCKAAAASSLVDLLTGFPSMTYGQVAPTSPHRGESFFGSRIVMFGMSTSEAANAPPEPLKTEHVAAPQGKKSCCVIGSGASGLTVMKELTSLGHTARLPRPPPRIVARPAARARARPPCAGRRGAFFVAGEGIERRLRSSASTRTCASAACTPSPTTGRC